MNNNGHCHWIRLINNDIKHRVVYSLPVRTKTAILNYIHAP